MADCSSSVPSQPLLKNSNDSTLLTKLKNTDDPKLYQRNVDWFVELYRKNALIINSVKTEEIIFGKPPTCPLLKVKIRNVESNQVTAYKYLSVMIDENLSWTPHIDFLGKRIQQRINFLRRLKSFGASSQITFYFLIL